MTNSPDFWWAVGYLGLSVALLVSQVHVAFLIGI
jgi:hypothetical protein